MNTIIRYAEIVKVVLVSMHMEYASLVFKCVNLVGVVIIPDVVVVFLGLELNYRIMNVGHVLMIYVKNVKGTIQYVRLARITQF